MVFTTLGKEGAPLIRYRSRDLTRLMEGDCPCGCTFPRHDRILGRSDDVVIFRGVNIYPGQVDEVLTRVPGIGSEYQVILDHGEDGRDYMLARVERARNGEALADSQVVKRSFPASSAPCWFPAALSWLDYGSLPRSEKKTKRIFDNRRFE